MACQPTTVSEGKQSVFVNITPNNAIAGAQFTLNFNPSILTANGVTEGNMLKQGGASTYFLPGQIDNQNGKVTGVAVAITGPGQTVSGAGTLAVIAMTAKYTSGTSPLNLTSVIVGDMSGKAVPANGPPGRSPLLAPQYQRRPQVQPRDKSYRLEVGLAEATLHLVPALPT